MATDRDRTPPPDQAARTRVYVDMIGDLFHAGHVALLQAAREHGDHLVVGMLSDEDAASYKRRPVMTLAERVAVVPRTSGISTTQLIQRVLDRQYPRLPS